MTVEELKEYLSKWPEDTDIYVVAMMPTKAAYMAWEQDESVFIEE